MGALPVYNLQLLLVESSILFNLSDIPRIRRGCGVKDRTFARRGQRQIALCVRSKSRTNQLTALRRI